MPFITEIAATAVNYAKKGRSVIPLNNDKHPMIKFADKPALSVEEATDLWTNNPMALIGMKTTDFFVIDADRHEGGEDGIANLEKFAYEHGDMFKDKNGRWILEETLAQRTAGGGLQFFFKKPKDVNIDQVIGIMPAVDIKGAANNYVVVPPSIRDGRKYEWIDVTKKMIEPPAALIDYIKRKGNETDKQDFKMPKNYQTNYINNRPLTKGSIKTIQVFDQIAYGIAEKGKRNATFTRFIGKLLSLGVSARTSLKLMMIANENTDNPLPEKEVYKVFNSILDKELNKQQKGDH